MAKIRVAVYEMVNDPKGSNTYNRDKRKALAVVEIEVPEADVRHRARWTDALRRELAGRGWELQACSEMHYTTKTAQENAPRWSAIVRTVAPALRKKPVTRGGKPVDDPGPRKPTMATRRRLGR